MDSFSDYIRSRFKELDMQGVLQSSLDILLGVDQNAKTVLGKININTVFDLGTSWLFANATTLSQTNGLNSLVERLGLKQNNLLKSNTVFNSVDEVPDLPIEFLFGITNTLAAELKEALDISTIRDFSLWPPRIVAHQLINSSLGTSLDEIDQAEVLRPKMGEYPTERVYYKSLAMLHMETENPQTILNGPISIDPAIDQSSGFGKPAIGVLLTTSQSWYAKGVTLGHMLHSLALAPGEATRIAVVDWSRKTSASVSESIQQTEQLDNVTNHSRAISEVQNAVANEFQEGESWSSGWAESSSTSEGDATSTGIIDSILNGGYSDSFTEQSSSTMSGATSGSWSRGEREISAELSQKVNDRTEQYANSVRNKRATAVREVSQSEHEQVSTRIVANYNHMHALTIQYYEVVQVYKVISKLHQAHRCLFIPFEYLDFDQPNSIDIVDRFRGTLVRSALSRRAKELLIDSETMVAIKPLKKLSLPFSGVSIAASEMVVATMRNSAENSDDSDDSADTLDKGFNLKDHLMDNRDALLNIANVIGRSPSRRGSSELFLPDETQLVALSFDGLSVKTVRIDRPGFAAASNTFAVTPGSGRLELPIGILLSSIKEIHISKNNNAKEEGSLTFICTYRSRPFQSSTILIDLKAGTTMQKVLTLQSDRIDREKELLKHLHDNRAYYSQQIFKSLDTASLVMLMSKFKWNGISLVDQIEPKPITVAGNYLVFKAPIEPEDSSGIIKNGTNKKWAEILKDHGIETSTSDNRLIPIPTGGVFAEAVLGRSNSAEKLDITRFWNWQDSPIPLQPTEISPVNVGSRGTAENLTPGDLSSPVLNIVNPTNIPDPAGLSASLGAIANANLFRDMGGLSGTQAIVDAAIRETLEATGQAGELASRNIQTEAQKQVAMSQIAGDIAKAAMGIPPTNSTEGISAQGAKINQGKDMDKRGVSGSSQSSNSSTSSPGTDGQSSGSNSNDTVTPETKMSGSSREAAYSDQAALGYSPGGLGALSNLVTGGLTPAVNTSMTFEQECEKILKDLYPGGEMNNVKVKKYGANKNPIIRIGGGYDAWTNSGNLVFVDSKYDDKSLGASLVFVLKHEAIHVLQFKQTPGVNFSYLDMLKAEMVAYPDTEKWLKGQATTHHVAGEATASQMLNQNEINSILPTAKATSDYMKEINDLKNKFFVNKDFSAVANTHLASLINNTSNEVRCAYIALVHKKGLPDIKNSNPYTVPELYTQTPNKTRFTALGYPPP